MRRMKLIDRYVYAVTQHFQKDLKDDISKELRANIEDMLPEDYSENDVYQVLEKLGNPRKLANEYNPNKRYLIGPLMYEQYLSVLKLVVGICVTVFVCLAIFGWAIEPPVEGFEYSNLSVLFGDLISAAFEGGLQSALWVTLVFVILERSGIDTGTVPFSKKEWTPKDLPAVTISSKKKISRGETIFSICCTVLFASFIFVKPQLIAVYFTEDNGTFSRTPLFDVERLKAYLILLFILVIVQLGISIWKYITKSWNLPLAVVNSIYNVATCIIVIVMLKDKVLINLDFFYKILEHTDASSTMIAAWIDRSKWVFIAIFVAISAWDIISGIVKSLSQTGEE
jgi:hypothetical protein